MSGAHLEEDIGAVSGKSRAPAVKAIMGAQGHHVAHMKRLVQNPRQPEQ
jgi:hypothetical protein